DALDGHENLHGVLPSGEIGFSENARSRAISIVEWRHGYALFLQLQRFHASGGRFAGQYMDVYVHVNILVGVDPKEGVEPCARPRRQ
ncbi:hypothetical protein, partial [Rhizobium sp. L18]|uniref:hypothetical protein n=1 Tax=Rhizobium sp. L18 TaxID=2035451 RepID=UPI001FE0DCA4